METSESCDSESLNFLAWDRPTLSGALLNLSLYIFPSYGPAVIVRSTRTTLHGASLLVFDGLSSESLAVASVEEEDGEEEEEEEDDDYGEDDLEGGETNNCIHMLHTNFRSPTRHLLIQSMSLDDLQTFSDWYMAKGEKEDCETVEELDHLISTFWKEMV